MKNNTEPSDIVKLKAIYAVFEQQVSDYYGESGKDHLICREKCATCCTCNVILTRLEAAAMVQDLTDAQQQAMRDVIDPRLSENRYIPQITTNRFARYCMENKPVPEEDNNPAWGSCALLINNLCSQYENRPFGCRALMSSIDCKKSGYAQVAPFVLTLNNLFSHYIEHLDCKGFSGNLVDMLDLFLSGRAPWIEPDKTYEIDTGRFVQNEPIRVLMVPPEHQAQIRSVIEKINKILGL